MAKGKQHTHSEIIKELKQKVYKPVYFFSGEEPYFIDLLTSYIASEILAEEERDFNQVVFYGKETDFEQIISEAKRFPMMVNYCVVIIKEAQNLNFKNEASIKILENYLDNPQHSTLLVFAYKGKFDKRTKIVKKIQEKGLWFDSQKIHDNQITGWIQNFIKEKQYDIEIKAAHLLFENLGNDLGKISGEIEKLLVALPEKMTITPLHIEQNIGISKDYNVFELQNAFMKKDAEKVFKIISYFEANPKSAPIVLVIGNLYYLFAKLLLCHSISGNNPRNVAIEIGVNPYYVNDYLSATKKYSFLKLKEIINNLRIFDLKSKGVDNVSESGGDLLKELAYKILN